MTIKSLELYQALYQAFSDAKLQLAYTDIREPKLFIFAGFSKDEINFQLSAYVNPGFTELKVEGKDLQAVVEEFAHRAGFQVSQNNLQLSAPIEGEEVTVEPPSPFVEPDDEIPF